MSLLPWPELMAAALRLGLAPEQFWRLSLAEWRLLASARGGVTASPMTRAELAALDAALFNTEIPHG